MSVNYELLKKQFAGLADVDKDPLALSANFVALLYSELPDINWLGIYVARGDDLVLGPFQGPPACVRIPVGQGVCGTAARNEASLRVANVHDFDGHIVCDPASNSELVVPLIASHRLIGVLDVDSPLEARFSPEDQAGVEMLCATFIEKLQLDPQTGGSFI